MRARWSAGIAVIGSLLALLGATAAGAPPAEEQREPELKELLRKILTSADCFGDRYEAEVWHKAMEPRLRAFVPRYEDRLEILDHVYCEAKRDPDLQIPPDLVLALIEVESRFDPWAVSRAGAVGLMQVMPFWPTQLGMQNQLVRAAPNIRMGCEILRYYLRAEHHNWARALARYNGSAGRNDYPALIMSRWQHAWRF
ncbi:MAG: lytic transglycosylase domain-containing protein [Steroidobacteraceae bacterium]|jgi:soluble lytic murein transglycosylase-like protein